MQVSFNGIKNVSSMIYKRDSYTQYAVSAQLTNDESGNDLDEYKKLLDILPQDASHYNDSRFIRLSYFAPYDIIFFNSHAIELTKDEIKNLKMCDYIAKINNKIMNKPINDFKIEERYLNSDDFLENTLADTGRNYDFCDYVETIGFDNFFSMIENPRNAKNVQEKLITI
ncbi:hypothetical protein J6E39_04670 [bacterium]|nr:hypothetical protein [bacterium]